MKASSCFTDVFYSNLDGLFAIFQKTVGGRRVNRILLDV